MSIRRTKLKLLRIKFIEVKNRLMKKKCINIFEQLSNKNYLIYGYKTYTLKADRNIIKFIRKL